MPQGTLGMCCSYRIAWMGGLSEPLGCIGNVGHAILGIPDCRVFWTGSQPHLPTSDLGRQLLPLVVSVCTCACCPFSLSVWDRYDDCYIDCCSEISCYNFIDHHCWLYCFIFISYLGIRPIACLRLLHPSSLFWLLLLHFLAMRATGSMYAFHKGPEMEHLEPAFPTHVTYKKGSCCPQCFFFGGTMSWHV